MEFASISDIEIIGLNGVQKLKAIDIHEKLNEHGRVTLEIMIDPQWSGERFCKENACAEVQIKVKHELVICGYVRDVRDEIRDGLHIYTITLTSYSQKTDLSKKCRSFQETSASFEDVAEQALSEYGNAFLEWDNSGKNPINNPLYQYEETDWEFIKRIASSQGRQIVVNSLVKQPYLRIDPSNKQSEAVSEYIYSEYGTLSQSLSTFHGIKCADSFQLGSFLAIKEGMFRVVEKHAWLDGSELVFEYRLSSGETCKEIYNDCLTGLQLAGNVSDVINDKVKVGFDIDGGKGASYFYDWNPISSNVAFAMPEVGEKVYVRLFDARGKGAAAINCIRKNGSSCSEMSDSSRKIMQYVTKKMKLENDFIEFSNNELEEVLKIIDVEGIFAQVKSKMTIAMKKEMQMRSNGGNVNVSSPLQIVLRDLGTDGDADAELDVNQTIDCQGDTVQIQASARISYPPIDDAPVEIKRNWGKLLLKVLAAVVVVAAVAVLAVATGGTAAMVIGGALIAGAVTAAIAVGSQIYSDHKNGIKRDFLDYLYMGVDNFCTGAILGASMFTPWGTGYQLLGVGICSLSYQVTDRVLDSKFGGDFYDEDSSIILNVFFDVAFAGIAKAITGGLNKFSSWLQKMPKRDYIKTAKFFNKWFGKDLPTDYAHINSDLKPYFRGLGEKASKILGNKYVVYLILGGTESTPGADIPTSLATDSNSNPLLKWLTGAAQDLFGEDYDESYNQYSRIVIQDDGYSIIDFDADGNLVFE